MIAQIKSISKQYGNVEVLNKFTLDIYKNEIVCVLGASGCGKSTLLNILSGLKEPDFGEVYKNIDKVSYVFQEDRLLPWKTVYDNIRFVDNRASHEDIIKLIDDIGLNGFDKSYPGELSGGMKQRCSIARAFNYRAELLLMDEPFKSLDYFLRTKMIRQLLEVWQKNKNSIVYVTHEIDEALMLANRIVVLSNRPAKIMKIIEINERQKYRILHSNELTKIRNEIIELLTEDKIGGVALNEKKYG